MYMNIQEFWLSLLKQRVRHKFSLLLAKQRTYYPENYPNRMKRKDGAIFLNSNEQEKEGVNIMVGFILYI